MAESPAATVALNYRRTHERALKLAEDLRQEQLVWRPGPKAPSIGFHLWHMARWADHLQAFLNNASQQIWEAQGLAQRWGFTQRALGHMDTGMGMDDDASASLPLPGKDALLDYARRAFAAADAAVEQVGVRRFDAPREDPRTSWADAPTIGAVIIGNLAHDNRHLGMIEALRGVQGLRGTATR